MHPVVAAFEQCFNPRARGGRDLIGRRKPLAYVEFQSTRPRRARHYCLPGDFDHVLVSIHAPAEGATSPRSFFCPTTQSFNPRARGGRDPLGASRTGPILPFQSTRPRRARHEGEFENIFDNMFQSTRPRRARLSHHNSLIRRTVPVALREPNACCQ